ncbi:aldo/keto reductase [Methyloceanibacter methanicus]|uniref:Aldo/keto reductase n=1 Tax=Methyloceanibacter methanicus TaxID=1774968 RepID=A0A1E3W114_9HYPH|nr:aldo/keto reductase [Methyloceanibacter methanicus]ODR99443.1 aldo/keto reductase [Methyloceanibacter methanicus]
MILTRRDMLGTLAVTGAATLIPGLGRAQTTPLTKPIPSSGEAIPIVGLGSWITFNVGEDAAARDARTEIMRVFFEDGGRLIDSSPMYGSAQPVIGYALDKIGHPKHLFSADKVWTSDGEGGPAQIEDSRVHWGVDRFDLLQVHNLVSWEEHLDTLFAMKKAGRLRYVGITTSHGRRHDEFERIMREHDLDFAQVTYNMADRAAEDRILPLAQEKGIAVIANRPFRRKELIDRFEGKDLPPWADEIGAKSWAQFLLKFVVSHPAITCTIPATTRVDHVRENLASGSAPLPDAKMRGRMADYIKTV